MFGFENVAYFDTAAERDWFIANVEGIPKVTMTKLKTVVKDDIEMYPLRLDFDEEELVKGPPVDTSKVPF